MSQPDYCRTADSSAPLDTELMRGHPLEFIPYFRRWPRSALRDLIYTAVWNSLIALVFTAFFLLGQPRVGILRAFALNMLFAQVIGYTIHLLFMATWWMQSWLERHSLALRIVYYAGVASAGAFIGYGIAGSLLGWTSFLNVLLTLRGFGTITLLSLIITLILLAVFIPRERAARAEAELAQEAARAASAEQAAALARMKLLEAQVEPHFLYNTLAHVVSLVDTEPQSAKQMLERLIVLMRAAAKSAGAESTLGAQAAQTEAYLDLISMRMGARLTWTIDVPPELRALAVPPMLLQPLVENAIKHGLEPKIAGGRVDVVATRDDVQLVLTVTDTGLGVAAAPRAGSTGIGLANLRQRLQSVYAGAASVTLTDFPPTGTRVTVALPLGAQK